MYIYTYVYICVCVCVCVCIEYTYTPLADWLTHSLHSLVVLCLSRSVLARVHTRPVWLRRRSRVVAFMCFLREVCIRRVHTRAGAPLSANDGHVRGGSDRDGGGGAGEETRVLLCREHLKMYTAGSITLAHTIHALKSIPHTNKQC